MSDRDRDELAVQIAHPGAPTGMEITPDNCTLCRQAVKTADHILSLGWRRSTVTPEQVEAAAATLAYRARGTWQGSEDYWRMVARESAETFGLSVAEDGDSHG